MALLACTPTRQSAELIFATEQPVISLDPRFAIDAHSENAIELLFNGLLKVNDRLELVPDLAESFVAVDASHYTFKIRKGVPFHDGTQLRVQDVLYTFRSLMDEKAGSPYRGIFRMVKNLEVEGDDTLKVELSQPYAFFPLAARRPIVSEQAAEARGKEFAKLPIGTGPFRILQNLGREGLVLGAFKKGFGTAPMLETVRLKPVLDMNARVLELLKGSVDMFQYTSDGFAPGALEKLRANSELRLDTKPGTNVQYLNMNLKHPVLKNRAVRMAIAHAIDRDTIIRYKLSGYATAAVGLLPPTHWAFEPNVESYPFDPAKAKQLLAEAGVKDLKLSYKTSTNPQAIEIAQVIASQLEAVGIHVELRTLDFGVLLDDVKKGNFDIYSMQWTSVLSPDHYYEVFHSKSAPPEGLNRNFYSNPRVDALLEEGRRTVDGAKQKRIFSDVQKFVAHDVPCVPLWYPQHIAVMRSRVLGYEVTPRGTYDALTRVVFAHP